MTVKSMEGEISSQKYLDKFMIMEMMYLKD